MLTRLCVLALCLSHLSGCVAVPQDVFTESVDFSYAAPSQTPMSYDDLLCCYECTV